MVFQENVEANRPDQSSNRRVVFPTWLKRSLILFLACYLGSYIWLSRRGYAESAHDHAEGFYYISPTPDPGWSFKNHCCRYFYWPLNLLDRVIGLGREPACDPLMSLSQVEQGNQLDPQSLAVQSVGMLIGSPSFIAGKLR